MKKRTFLCLLALLLLLSSVACDLAGNEGGGNSTETSETVTTAVTSIDEELLTLGTAGKSAYCIIYTPQSPDGEDLGSLARSLAEKITSLAKGKIMFRAYSTSAQPDLSGFVGTIRLGDTAGAVAEEYDALRANDYRVVKKQNDLYLLARSYHGIESLSFYLGRQIFLRDDSLFLAGEAVNYTFSANYLFNQAKLGEEELSKYSIVYTDETEVFAKSVQKLLADNTGYILPTVMKSSYNGTSALVFDDTGAVAPTGGYVIQKSGKNLIFSGDGNVGRELLLNAVKQKISSAKGDLLNLDELCSTGAEKTSADMRIVSFNVLNSVFDGEVGARGKTISDALLSTKADLICLQEYDYVFRNSQNSVNNYLGSQYAEVTVNGVSTDKIWNPIFYDKNLYTLKASGMSDIYEQSKTDGFSCYETINKSLKNGRAYFRTLVWGVLERKSDGKQIIVSNLHYSPKDSDQIGEAQFCMNVLSGVQTAYPTAVLLTCGDYNSVTTSKGCGKMLKSGYVDTRGLAACKNEYGLHGASYDSAIDHILTTDRNLKVSCYAVLANSTTDDVSDHSPVVMQFSLE